MLMLFISWKKEPFDRLIDSVSCTPPHKRKAPGYAKFMHKTMTDCIRLDTTERPMLSTIKPEIQILLFNACCAEKDEFGDKLAIQLLSRPDF